MKLFLDQDVYFLTVKFLREAGHDVLCASDVGLARSKDEEILAHARESGRILVTRDRDFGRLALRRGLSPGILYLRMMPATVASVHQELAAILGSYTEARLREAFVVVEPGRYRFRKWEP